MTGVEKIVIAQNGLVRVSQDQDCPTFEVLKANQIVPDCCKHKSYDSMES